MSSVISLKKFRKISILSMLPPDVVQILGKLNRSDQLDTSNEQTRANSTRRREESQTADDMPFRLNPMSQAFRSTRKMPGIDPRKASRQIRRSFSMRAVTSDADNG